MAQELAHNYGRQHVNCGDHPDNVDRNYPYPPCQIAEVGAASYYGFDVTTRQPIQPNQTADFMSYADRTWVSDYTWRACSTVLPASPRPPQRPPAPKPEQRLRQRAGRHRRPPRRDRHCAGDAHRVDCRRPPARHRMYRQPARSIRAARPQVAYTLRLLNPDGAILLNQLLTPL